MGKEGGSRGMRLTGEKSRLQILEFEEFEEAVSYQQTSGYNNGRMDRQTKKDRLTPMHEFI